MLYRNDAVLYLDATGRPAFASTPDKPKATEALVAPESVVDGQWHHLVATVGDGATELWVDGARVATKPSANQAEFTGYWRLLGDSTDSLPDAPSNASVVGGVDEVAVYPFVLGEQAIKRHHALGIGATPEEPNQNAIEDTFSRSETGSWGKADTGQAWTVSGFTSRWSVAAGVGRYAAEAASGTPAVLGDTRATASDVTVTVGADKVPTGSGQFYSVIGRHLDARNGYSAKLKLSADGSVTGYLVQQLDGVSTNLAAGPLPGVEAGGNSRIRVRVQTDGSDPTTVRLRAWPAGTTEPTGWQLTATDDAAALQAPGSVALHPYLPGSATNAPVLLLADDLVVSSAPAADNQSPKAVLDVGPSRVATAFDGSRSSDPDGQGGRLRLGLRRRQHRHRGDGEPHLRGAGTLSGTADRDR